jgi:hypothetical protein
VVALFSWVIALKQGRKNPRKQTKRMSVRVLRVALFEVFFFYLAAEVLLIDREQVTNIFLW